MLIDVLDNGIKDEAKFGDAVRQAAGIVLKVSDYIDKHGNITLSCGSEWMYQDDNGQVDALELVADILDSLEKYENGEDEE